MSVIYFFSLIALSGAWLIPNHYAPWSSVYNDSCSALALVLLALGIGRLNISRSVPAIVWPVASVALIAPIQWLFNKLQFGSDALVSSLYVLGFTSAIAIGHAIAASQASKPATLLATAALASAVVSSIFAINQGLKVGGLGIWLQDVALGQRAFANLGQPNNLGTLIGFGAMGLLLLREQARCTKAFAAVLLLLLLVGAGLTQSRTSLTFGPLIAIGIWIAKRRGGVFVTSPRVILIAWVVQLLFAWAWPHVQSLLLLASESPLGDRGVQSLRFQMWPMLVDALMRSPWTGYGWLQVGEAELAVVNDYPPIGEMWMQGHNLFLELLLWCGLPLGLVLIALIVYWFISRGRSVRTKEGVIGYLVISIVGVHSMLEFPYQYAYFLIPAGLWIGQIEWSIQSRGMFAPKWNLLPQVLALVLLLCIWSDYGAVEEDFRLMRFETLRIGNSRASQPAPYAPFLSSLTAFLRFMRNEPRAGMRDEELKQMEAVVKRYPYALSLARFAQMEALNNRPARALETFKQIRQMYPPSVYQKLRRELHIRVAEGQSGLAPLDNAIAE